MVVSTDQIVHLLCRHLSLLAKSQHRGLTSTSTKIISCTLSLSLQEIFEQKLFRQASKICCAAVHVLHSEYESLPSGKRYKIPKCELNRSKYSFVPLSIKTTKPVVLGSASCPDSTQFVQLPLTCMTYVCDECVVCTLRVCVCMCACVRASPCMCVCVCARARACMCVFSYNEH